MGLKIALRPDEHTRARSRLTEDAPIGLDAPVQDHDEKLALVHGSAAATDALRLDGVSRGLDARCVEKSNGHAGEHDGSLDDVASRTRYIGDDRPVLAHEGVQEARLARVRRTDESDREAPMNHPAVARGLEPLLGLGTKPADGHPGRPDVLAHAFLGEVERDLEARDDVDESGLKVPDLVGQAAASARAARATARS